jgi:outer membrane lipopolysaccharide assembly protein LptE/RlpB
MKGQILADRSTIIISITSLLAAGLVVIAAGCGYHLVGTSSFLPEELQTMYVATFENQTKWADMDQRLTEAVVQEWVRRRRFQISEQVKDSDLVLRGAITSLRVAPVTFDTHGRATSYQMTLTAHVQLEDVRGDEAQVLWKDKAFSRRTSYDVDVSAVDYFDRQIEAMEDVSNEFARALVTAVLEGF